MATSKAVLAALTLTLIAGTAFGASAPSEPSLCNQVQRTLFSCATGTKVVSVCADSDISLEHGGLIYIFGKQGEKPELIYPKTPKPIEESFTFCRSGYAKGKTQELSFSVGAYTYTLHVDTHAFRGSASGIYLEKNGKYVTYLPCNVSFQNSDLYELTELGVEPCQPRHVMTPGP